jgi:hypothetical protein
MNVAMVLIFALSLKNGGEDFMLGLCLQAQYVEVRKVQVGKNGIPCQIAAVVVCPAMTQGIIGYFRYFRKENGLEAVST